MVAISDLSAAHSMVISADTYGVLERATVAAVRKIFFRVSGHEPNLDNKMINSFDNADSDVMDNVLSYIGSCLRRTLYIVVSNSAWTKETRNALLEAKAAFARRYVNVNAYHEPGVKTREMAGSTVIPLQTRTSENRYRRM